MLINLRNALMSGRRLPYDAEVEYIESTGTQYINTGVDAAVGLSVDTTFAYTAQTSYGILFGVQSPANNFMEVRLNANTTTLTALVKRAVTTMSAVTFNDANRFVGKWTSTGADLDLNGTTYTSTAGAVAGSANYPLYIFAGNQDNAAVYHSKARVYSFKITDANGTLVRDFIPVRKGTVGYLYDRVSRRLFGNAGTGDFVLGPDVVPVEYIESHGTEYIDTGVVPTPMLDYSISFAFTSMSSYSYIMGAWSSDNSNYYDLAEQSNTLIYAGLGTTQQAIANIPAGVFSTVEKRSLDIYIDGVKKKSYSADIQSGSISSTILLFGVHRNYGPGYIVAAQPLRVSKYSLTLNGANIRNLLPVRIGTEGAMMDVLTRRIYRNAGTGAFAYGNDLKYPIPAA